MTDLATLKNIVREFRIAVDLTLEKIELYSEETHPDVNNICIPPAISRDFTAACQLLLAVKPGQELSEEAQENLADIQTVLQQRTIPMLSIADTQWRSVFGEDMATENMALKILSTPDYERILIEAETAMLTAQDQLELTIRPQTELLMRELGIRLE